MSLENLGRDVVTRSAWYETVSLGYTLAAVWFTRKKRSGGTKVNEEDVSLRIQDKVMWLDVSV